LGARVRDNVLWKVIVLEECLSDLESSRESREMDE
jgi:hypothetical protein